MADVKKGTPNAISDGRLSKVFEILSDKAARHLNQDSMSKLLLAALLVLWNTTAHANPFDPIKGSWTGAVKFDTRHDPNAHSVGTLSMHVGSDGAVDAIHANGCKITGIVREGPGRLFYIDVRMKGCAYPDFNRRWSGTLVQIPKDQIVEFSLAAQESTGGGVRFFDAVGTLQK